MMKRLLITFPIAILLATAFPRVCRAQAPEFELGKNIEILVNLMRDLSVFYVDEIEPSQLLEDAAEGMVSRLDPYTIYLPAEDMETFEMLTTGKYAGIGSLIRKKGDWVIISQPYEGFPADRAGLRSGDKIIAIDGDSAEAMDVSEVSSRLKGDPGTLLKLTVEKFGTGQVEQLEIRRERISIPGVPYYGMLTDGIGYIQHNDFTDDSGSEVLEAFMELRKNVDLRGLVLDYRGNGGGVMREAVKILSMFVPKGTEVVSMKGKTMDIPVVFRTENEPIDTEIPIVVLTSSGSASAAEIVAGAIQDLDRGIVVGQRTYGKGLVQATRPLGYNSFLKVTTAKYYIPSGRCVQAIDYAHRNDDGSVASVPDSLVQAFTTSGGRVVYDGGGVTPDVTLAPDFISRFSLTVYGHGLIDDYADIYVSRHPEGVDRAKFKLTDDEFAEFASFIQTSDIEYKPESRRVVDLLKVYLARENYSEKIDQYVSEIETLLTDNTGMLTEMNREQLTELLEGEIIQRYYYSRGLTEYKLPSDAEVTSAIEILKDPQRYLDLLAPGREIGKPGSGHPEASAALIINELEIE